MDGKLTTNENYIKAVNLNSKIIVSAQAAQQNLYDMCVAFKEMRDSKLYKELGYSEFGDYCEQETGFKRSQAYNYIAIAEKLPEDFVQPVGQIGMRKLLLLTKISEEERAEITAEGNLEDTTVKELQQKIKELKSEHERTKDDLRNVETNYDNLNQRYQKLGDENAKLGAKVRELESRPVEVATQTVEKAPKGYIAPQAYSDMVDKYEMRIDEMESEQLALRREAHAKQTELENQIAELEKKSGDDPEATFKLICGMLRNPLSQLMVFAGQNRDYILETKKFLNGYLNALEDKK